MPGKQARVLCPVCAEPMPPDETECANCGAFVIDEAVVRLSRAFGLDREKALKLFEAGFRHTKQLRDRDPNGILEKGEVGLLFICTNCGGFVAAGDTKCPRCAAEFEAEPEPPGVEEDILDLVLCPTCGADNDPELEECEICGTALRGRKEPSPVATEASLPIPPATRPRPVSRVLDKLDEFLRDLRPLVSEVPRPDAPRPAIAPRPPEAKAKTPVSIPQPAPASSTKKLESAPAPSAPVPIPSKPASPMPKQQPVDQTRPAPATEMGARLAPRDRPSIPSFVKIRGRAEAPSRIPRKNARPAVGEARTRITAETAGGLVLAASTSLLLAGALNQPLVSAGIAAFLIGFGAYLSWDYVRGTRAPPPRFDALFLGTGTVLTVSALLLRRNSTSSLRRQLIRAERDMGRKDYEQSLADYDRAIATARPGVTGAEIPWYGKGATLILLGRYDEALRAIDTALDINPHNEVAWLNKGNAFTKLGRLVDALRCFNAAIKVNPAYEVAWNNKGNALARLGKFDEALGCYERALEIDAAYRGAWVNKGFVLTKLGRFDEAASCADRAWPGSRLTADEAGVDPGAGTSRSELNPVAWVLRRPLNRRVGVRIARADVCDVQAEDIPIPFDRLSRIGNDDRNRVDAEDGHASRDGIGDSAMNLSVSGRWASALRRPASVHLRVPLHDLVVGDPVDLLLHRELVLRLPCLHDPPGGGFALELRDEELPLSATRLERRDHLGAVEDDVAGPHVELVDNRFAQVEEQVVQRGEHELPTEFRLLDLLEAVLHRPHHGSLPAGEEAFHQPSLGLELPQPQAGLPHVVLETLVPGKRLGRCHTEAADDPPQGFAAGRGPADLPGRGPAIAVVRVPSHVEAPLQLPPGRPRWGPAEVRKDQEPLARNRSFFLGDLGG